ncbi:MAG: serine protease [Deltaproteobacteria bacterium]|nr:serine protease [Deltaproteobacteria bacterium]
MKRGVGSVILILLLVLVLTPVTAVTQRLETRIINGRPVDSGEYPWMVSLHSSFLEAARGHFCGGILTSSRTVLTAAHCAADFQYTPSGLSVSTGDVRLTAMPAASAAVEGIIVHPLYDPVQSNSHDIAILRLSQDLPGPFLAIIDSATLQLESAGKMARVLGWGTLDANFDVRPDVLQVADVPLVENELCSQRLGLDFNLETMLCAGRLASSAIADDGVDSCQGDSGGPLIVQSGDGWRLVGLVSWGLNCGSHRYWGVYTRLSRYMEWLASSPGVPPRSLSKPQITGAPIVGEKVECIPGEWSGDGPLQFKTEWVDSSRERTTRASSQQGSGMKLKSRDVGRRLVCRVTASNNFGKVQSLSDSFGPIFPASRKITINGKQRRYFKHAAVECGRKRCKLLLSTKRNEVSLSESLVLDSACDRSGECRGSAWRRPKRISANAWLVSFVQSAGARKHVLYLRMHTPEGSLPIRIAFQLRSEKARGKAKS